MVPRRTPLLAAAAATAIALGGGCGLEDPYSKPDKPRPPRSQHTTPRAPSEAPGEQSTTPAHDGELAGEVPPQLRGPTPTRFPEAGRTPKATLALAAGLYGNWTSSTAPKAFRRIAALSVGDARAQLRQIAAQSGVDTQQRGVRSRSSIVSIRVAGRGQSRSATLLTRDTVTGPGLPDSGAQYNVTRAELVQRSGRWVIARWQPQP